LLPPPTMIATITMITIAATSRPMRWLRPIS
jgi:hypothetical protein